MRIKLATPVPGPIEATSYFSVDNARIVRRNIVCTLAFWSDSGRKIDQYDKELSAEDYAAWCATDIDSDDEAFFTAAHLKERGLAEAPKPPPPEPPKPETEGERIAREAVEAKATEEQRLADIASLEQQLKDISAQLTSLKSG